MKIKSLFILVLVPLLLFTACNSDASEGIFRQISKSEKEVYVGKVDLLKVDSNGDIYALTADGGLQKYIPTTKTWTRLDGGQESVARALVTQTGDVYYTHYPTGTPRKHEWLKEDQSTTGVTRFVLNTSAHGGWELAKDDESASPYYLYLNLNPAPVEGTDLSSWFSYPPELLESENNALLLTGVDTADSSKYLHKLWTGAWHDLTLVGNSSEAVVAFSFVNAKQMVAITASGKIYQGSNEDYKLTDSGQSLTLQTYGSSGKPVPTFLIGDMLWMQGETEFYKIDRTNGTLTKISDKFAPNLRSHTFKVTSWLVVGTEVYGGTAKNGIVKISNLDGESVKWL